MSCCWTTSTDDVTPCPDDASASPMGPSSGCSAGRTASCATITDGSRPLPTTTRPYSPLFPMDTTSSITLPTTTRSSNRTREPIRCRNSATAASGEGVAPVGVLGVGRAQRDLGLLLAAGLPVDEAHDGDLHAGVLRHPPGELERLPVVGPSEEDDADAVRHLLGADLLAAAEAAVDEDGHGAGRLAQDPAVHRAPFGPEVLGLGGVVPVAVPRLALVERQDDEGHALVLGDGGDILVHGVERGHGGHGADVDVPELRVRVEGDVHLVVRRVPGAARAQERQAVAPRGARQEDGGGALGELHHTEDVELDEAARLRVPADGLDEVDEGRHVVAAADAGQHAQLLGVDRGRAGRRGGRRGGGGALELAVVELAAAAAARRLVEGHDGGRGDEGGDQRHEHQDGERLVVQNLQRRPHPSPLQRSPRNE
ncbi:hypothetical protein U9M48_041591 [Paspalum notatum var. saurae]|uniref:SpoVT-AbrB domain-containing protein n=1 Tax=Paspalum notatum var. saurae TaxID=547442 RepID=A0AAQ3UNP2_PASNO